MTHQITCPVCQKSATKSKKLPFCSDRCRKIDFFRWWDGRYTIAESVEMDLDPENGPQNYDPDDDNLEIDRPI